jgi:hypothetical protein
MQQTAAGASALGVAVQLDLDIGCVQRQLTGLAQTLQELRDRQSRFRAGAAGEQHVVQVVTDLIDTGWTLLTDRRWPGTRRANIDILLAGPGGVFVIDVKRWKDVRIDGGTLWRGDEAADVAVDNLAAQAAAVQGVLTEQGVLAEQGLALAEVLPLLVIDRADVPPTRLGPVHVLGERQLSRFLLRRAARLTAEQVEQVGKALDRACPPMPTAQPAPPVGPSAGSVPRSAPADTQQALLDTSEVWRILADAAAADPIETWMTWLHPTQAKLVTRSWSGPARIRGAAGTGKTVVALHRARHLALTGRRVLFTSYVSTLGPVFRSLFARLAPDLVDRVQFSSVHQVAARLLRSAGTPLTVDDAALEDCFARAWSSLRRDSPLADLGVPPRYWREEIAHVIKGRGVTDLEAYSQLRRVGRRTGLQPVHRAAMWELFTQYERRLRDRGLTDWDDVLLRALQLVDSGAAVSAWDAVIVDEVQDLSGTGLRLLHRLAGDRPDGLLLVGDGQQSIYPGGFTIAETGVSVVGRSTVLDVNYRNGAAILQHALAMVGADPFDDLDPTPADGDRAVRAMRSGGSVVRAESDDATSQRFALLSHLADLRAQDVRHGDIAVLVPTNQAARTWRDTLTAANVPAMLLADYDGTRQDAVKVGTFERAKALEFAHVLIPDSDAVPGPRRRYESDDAYAERAAHERTRLYVGCTRARDGLWLGTPTLGVAGRA